MDDEKMLNFIAKNAQMGVVGIDAVKDYAKGEKFKRELASQRKEYKDIYNTAHSMLSRQGCETEQVGTMARVSTEMMSRMKTMADNSDSKIAEMMLQGSAMGVAKVIRNAHEYQSDNEKINILTQKLRETEERNIENMKHYL